MISKEQPIIVGLDIGTTKVVAIAGRKDKFGKLEILGFGKADSLGVTHGMVINIEQCIKSIQAAMDACLTSNPNLKVKEVYVGIAGQHIKSMQTRGDRVRTNMDSEISKEDIDLLIRDQRSTYIPAGDQIIDIIPQDYTVDSMTKVINPIGMCGVKIGANFHLITGDKNAVKNIKRCVDKSSLITRDIVLQPLASAAAVMHNEDLEVGVAIVDIGGGTTDMAVFHDGILRHTAVIPFAGVNITNDIKTGLGVLRLQAEQMKVQFGSAWASEASANAYITIPGLRGLPSKEISVKNLSHIIQARMQEILDHVVFQLKLVDLDKKLGGGIILTGGGAMLKHVKQITELATGLNTRIGLPDQHLNGDASNAYAKELMNPMYSTCIGLILRGYYDFEQGNMRYTGENANYVKLNTEMFDAPVAETTVVDTAVAPTVEEQIEVPVAKAKQIKQPRTEIFEVMRNKFMKFFEVQADDTEFVE